MESNMKRPAVAEIGRLAVVAALVVAAVLILTAIARTFSHYAYLSEWGFAAIILLGGVFLTREIAGVAASRLHDHTKKTGLLVRNAIVIVGYLVSAFAALSYVSFSPTSILATAAFSGLVLGLALQPTLGSFFAGLLILAAGTVRPGNKVRIMTWHVPFQSVMTPGYKYFSPDQIYAGYMAEVIEIGLFYTTVVTEEGQTVKFPNTIIATDAAVVTYTDRDYFFNVRYEFSNKHDPDIVLARVKEAVAGYPVVSCFINEQSDKEFYIVKVVLNAKEKDHSLLKSETLAKLIKLHRRLEAEAEVASK